ncbi:hypothetical protein BCR41DRAFT_394852 [Lobosporangium transversale]|uniref:Uncharacterized protein n=1 Tax=Lobosporangium transversale TaxID=64571 RepID=A0A1Y2GTL9_9FUNG|nr:hypothetical protein BCR41DRAFT_394852 [Lobosporangium transversale]ORZ20942.1 hypothetical protein BCR41DRAFT_394852 [Lobosporangium transversale]|eukprot:XP_021882851.1 hypothetical protein BCR41DRAFT_394852 [Lobosporangium transversale]
MMLPIVDLVKAFPSNRLPFDLMAEPKSLGSSIMPVTRETQNSQERSHNCLRGLDTKLDTSLAIEISIVSTEALLCRHAGAQYLLGSLTINRDSSHLSRLLGLEWGYGIGCPQSMLLASWTTSTQPSRLCGSLQYAELNNGLEKVGLEEAGLEEAGLERSVPKE